jgi:hypothetical protein
MLSDTFRPKWQCITFEDIVIFPTKSKLIAAIQLDQQYSQECKYQPHLSPMRKDDELEESFWTRRSCPFDVTALYPPAIHLDWKHRQKKLRGTRAVSSLCIHVLRGATGSIMRKIKALFAGISGEASSFEVTEVSSSYRVLAHSALKEFLSNHL